MKSSFWTAKFMVMWIVFLKFCFIWRKFEDTVVRLSHGLALSFFGIDVIWPALIHKINLFIDCIPIITFQLFVNVYKNSNSELKLFMIGPQQVFFFFFFFLSSSLELISILKVERHFNSQIAMVKKVFHWYQILIQVSLRSWIFLMTSIVLCVKDGRSNEPSTWLIVQSLVVSRNGLYLFLLNWHSNNLLFLEFNHSIRNE